MHESQIEREEDYLEQQRERGDITEGEFNHEMQELRRDYRAAAEEAAEDAYKQELSIW